MCAGRVREDRPVGRATGCKVTLRERLPHVGDHRHGRRLAALRRAHATVLTELSVDNENALLEVHLPPRQAADLTEPEAGEHREADDVLHPRTPTVRLDQRGEFLTRVDTRL